MQHDHYLRTIAWATIQTMGPTVKVVVVPTETPGTYDVHAGLLDGTRVSFQLSVPWPAETADADRLRDYVRRHVRKWQIEFLTQRQART